MIVSTIVTNVGVEVCSLPETEVDGALPELGCDERPGGLIVSRGAVEAGIRTLLEAELD